MSTCLIISVIVGLVAAYLAREQMREEQIPGTLMDTDFTCIGVFYVAGFATFAISITVRKAALLIQDVF